MAKAKRPSRLLDFSSREPGPGLLHDDKLLELRRAVARTGKCIDDCGQVREVSRCPGGVASALRQVRKSQELLSEDISQGVGVLHR